MDISLSVPCRGCSSHVHVTVDKHDWMRFEMHEGLVQNLFPSHDANEREAIKGQRDVGNTLCGTCWDVLFSEDDDESTEGAQ